MWHQRSVWWRHMLTSWKTLLQNSQRNWPVWPSSTTSWYLRTGESPICFSHQIFHWKNYYFLNWCSSMFSQLVYTISLSIMTVQYIPFVLEHLLWWALTLCKCYKRNLDVSIYKIFLFAFERYIHWCLKNWHTQSLYIKVLTCVWHLETLESDVLSLTKWKFTPN